MERAQVLKSEVWSFDFLIVKLESQYLPHGF
jgi:hypothetical protein